MKKLIALFAILFLALPLMVGAQPVASGSRTYAPFLQLGPYTPPVTTGTLYNVAGVLYWNGGILLGSAEVYPGAGVSISNGSGWATSAGTTVKLPSVLGFATPTTNGAAGTFTATAGTTSTVNNTSVTANSLIVGLVAKNAAGATLLAGGYYQSAVSAGNSFTITFTLSAAGTESINYFFVN